MYTVFFQNCIEYLLVIDSHAVKIFMDYAYQQIALSDMLHD